MLDSTSVWSRTEETSQGDIISGSMYNLVIGLVLVWGFALNYIIIASGLGVRIVESIGLLPVVIGYIVAIIGGIYLYHKSSNPIISFIGYNLVVVPIGILISPFVLSVDREIVTNAVLATGAVTVVMMLLGTMYPSFFERMGATLAIALLTAVIVELVLAIFYGWSSVYIDWIMVGIFSGYIGYDWARANQIPKTIDNAVDSAASLYLDIINLFLRILRIMARR